MRSNITLTMPTTVIRQAKILAAQRDTSVSSLVADLLQAAVGQSDGTSVWDREEAAMDEGLLSVGPITWTRDEVHSR